MRRSGDRRLSTLDADSAIVLVAGSISETRPGHERRRRSAQRQALVRPGHGSTGQRSSRDRRSLAGRPVGTDPTVTGAVTLMTAVLVRRPRRRRRRHDQRRSATPGAPRSPISIRPSRRYQLFNEAAEVLLDPDRARRVRRQPAWPPTADADPSACRLTDLDDPTLAGGQAGRQRARGPRRRPTRPPRRAPLAARWASQPGGARASRWSRGVVARWLPCVGGRGWLADHAGPAPHRGVATDTAACPDRGASGRPRRSLSYDSHHLDASRAQRDAVPDPERSSKHVRRSSSTARQAERPASRHRDQGPLTSPPRIVRSGTDRVDVLVFVDPVTTNQAATGPRWSSRTRRPCRWPRSAAPWLVDGLTTTRS